MNCMKYHRIHTAKLAEEKYKKYLADEKEKMANMTDEEREAYLADKEARRKELMKLMAIPATVSAMTNGAYSK